MTSTTKDSVWVDYKVRIPDLDGEGIKEERTIQVPVKIAADGTQILTKEAQEIIENTYRRFMGLMTPEEIENLRKVLKLTQKQMSELIQAGEKTYTRWESGRARLSRSMNIILCGIRDGFLTTEYLKRLQEEGSNWNKHAEVFEKKSKAHPTFIIMDDVKIAFTGAYHCTVSRPAAFVGRTEKDDWSAFEAKCFASAPPPMGSVPIRWAAYINDVEGRRSGIRMMGSSTHERRKEKRDTSSAVAS